MTEQTTAAADGHAKRFDSFVALKSAHGALAKRRRTGGDGEEFVAGVISFLRGARATGAVLPVESERWDAQTLIDYWFNYLCREGVRLDEGETVLAPYDPTEAPTLDESSRPYVGLDAFGERMHELFFGRQGLIDEMMKRLAGRRWLAVLGESGSGKSSLVQAGLVPQLKAGGVKGSADWHYFQRAVPGPEPLNSLALLAAPEGAPADRGWLEEQARAMAQDSGHLLALVNRASGGRPAFVLIDQFEEIFTLTSDEAVRRVFIDNLLRICEYPDARHTVVVTMRSDHEPYVTKIENLQARFAENHVRVTALNASELRDAILKPAERAGLKFEDGLIDELVRQVLGEPGVLPLLQFTLLKLWDMRRQNLVTWEAFKRIGGCQVALTNSADEVFRGLNPTDQVRAKHIFLRLVRPSEGIEVFNNRITRESLYIKGESPEHIDRVLGAFLAAGLLRETDSGEGGGSRIEVAHEALIRHWQTLVTWLNEERVNIRSRLRLSEAAKQWDRLGRDPSALLRGALLAEALKLDDLNALERKFVERSRSRQRRWKILVWAGAALIAVALVVLAVNSYLERNRAREAEAKARAAEAEADSRRFAALSASYRDDRLDLSLLLSLQALSVKDTFEARSSLIEALGQSPQLITFLRGQNSPSRVLAFEDGGKRVVSVASDRSTTSWDTETFTPTTLPAPALPGVRAAAFSPDLLRVAFYKNEPKASPDPASPGVNRIFIADAHSGAVIHDIKPRAEFSIFDLVFSPNGKLLAVSSIDSVGLIDTDTGKWLRDLDSPMGFNRVTFNSDSSLVAIYTRDDLVVRSVSGTLVRKFTVDSDFASNRWVSGVAFSPGDKNVLAVAVNGEGVRLLRLNGAGSAKIIVQSTELGALAFSPDGRRLAAVNASKNIVMWELPERESGGGLDLEVFEFSSPQGVTMVGHTGRVSLLAFSPDGKLLASGDADNNVILWAAERRWPLAKQMPFPKTNTTETVQVQGASKIRQTNSDRLYPTSAMALSPDQKLLASVFRIGDGVRLGLVLWDVATQRARDEKFIFPADEAPAANAGLDQLELWRSRQRDTADSLSFSRDGHTVAAVSGPAAVVLVDTASGRMTQLPLKEKLPELTKTSLVRFSPQADVLAVVGGGRDGLVHLWDVPGNGPLRTFGPPPDVKGRVADAAFRPDGKILAVIVTPDSARPADEGAGQGDAPKRDGEILLLFDVDSGRQLSLTNVGQPLILRRPRSRLEPSGDSTLAWGPDGKTFAVSSGDTVSLWDAQDPANLKAVGRPFQTQSAGLVSSMLFCRNGNTLAVAGPNGSIELWDVKDRRQQGSLKVSDRLRTGLSLVGNPYSNELFSNSPEGDILIWDLNLESWKQRACAITNRDFTKEEIEQFNLPENGGATGCRHP
ncbi:MAG TPA: hypothetical protein VJ866_20820 [Pyrinomonadaceae bacterium]|nr:hypothetical protein [Pyrinomonadaceae bacterium]